MSATAFTHADAAGRALEVGKLRRAAHLYARAILQFRLDPPNPESENDVKLTDANWPAYWEGCSATALRIANALSLVG